MKKIKIGKTCFVLTFTFFIVYGALFNQAEGSSYIPEGLPGPGAIIPPFSLPSPTNEVYKSYLRLEKAPVFQPADMKWDMLLIEVFNVYCASCQFMRPYMNELYDKIEKAPELKGKVKMIGIGAGNDKWETGDEEKRYKFPIFPDDDYAFHRLVGQPPTPFLIFARPYTQGRLLVVDTHLGRLEDSDELLALVRKAFKADISTLTVKPEEKKGMAIETDLVIPLSDDELLIKVKQSLKVMGEEIVNIGKIELGDLGIVYMGVSKNSKARLFARIVARKIPCADCHDIFYIYSFNSEGKFLSFIPIAISKLDNEDWDEADVAKIQNRFKGTSLLETISFNPKIDAVTSATISSKLIYDSMGKTKLVIEKLTSMGYIVKK
jgi:hypothetical protein